MDGFFRHAVKSRTSLGIAILGLLVPFSIFFGNFANILFIMFKQQAVPSILNVIFKLSGIVFGSVFFYLLLIKLKGNNSDAQGKSERKNAPLWVFCLNFFFGICLIQSLKYLLPLVYRPELTIAFFSSVLVLFLIIVLLIVFLTVSWLIVQDLTGMHGYFGVFLKGMKLCFSRLSFLLIMFSLGILSLIINLFLYEEVRNFLHGTAMSSMLSLFYRNTVVSCVIGAFLILFVKIINAYAVNLTENNKNSSYIPGLIILLLSTFGMVYTLVPMTGTIYNEIDKQYGQMISSAEVYRTEGKLYLCGYEYKKAYALTQAFKGYLYSLQLQKDDKLTEKAKSELRASMDLSFKNAYDFYPNGGIVYYLDAMRQIETNPSNGISLMEYASRLAPDFHDSSFELLGLYQQNNTKEKTREIIDSLIGDENFIRPASLNRMGLDTINRLLDKYNENEKLCLENFTTNAVFYYENQLYPEAMAELARIQQVLPDNLVVNYLIAITDLEIKTDNKPYDAAINASQNILKQYPDEQWAQDLAAGVAIRAGNQSVMESSLQKSYEKNPDNLDNAEQYAYSLLRKNNDFNFTDSAKQAEAIIDGILSKADNRWFSYYCKAVIELFKRDYEKSLDYMTKFSGIIMEQPDVHSIYDDFYNLYVLKYCALMQSDGKATEAINKREDSNPLMFNYAYGAYYWRIKDFENGEKFLKSTIDNAPDFSKPYFLLGNVYFEQGGTQNKPEYFVKAEEQFHKSLSLFPEDPYTWFSLGHVLKRMERFEEALGAFQKTLSYMPAEDHGTDHFGISIHSTYQVQEIKDLLKKKEGQ